MQHRQNAIPPERIVILGAQGFVGNAVVQRVSQVGVPILPLGRKALDLTHLEATSVLVDYLRPTDALVIAVAEAPCKNSSMMLNNIHMMHVMIEALTQKPVDYVLYVSSDAVYADSMVELTENAITAPSSLHGTMHLARESMLQAVVPHETLAIIRPTLLYGKDDPHHGYGPNRFYRCAQAGKPIELFGQGEEQRDHVYIEDLAEMIYLCLMHRSYGILNAVSGQVISFYDIAQHIVQCFNSTLDIIFQPRVGSIPHNGYRAFNHRLCMDLFPHFKWRSFQEGLQVMHQQFLSSSSMCDSHA